MTDNLLAPAEAGGAPNAAPTSPASAVRPEHIPEKFWDSGTNSVRTEALLRSYGELERKLGGAVSLPREDAAPEEWSRFHRALGVPERPEDYAVTVPEGLGGPAPEVNRRLHEAGFTPRQVQLVYDLAAEVMTPMIAQSASDFEAERQTARLVEHFGGAEKWRETARQLLAWGRANLPEPVLEALSTTHEGVLALHSLMKRGEPALLRAGTTDGAVPTEEDLRRMMSDPRYWKLRDPALIAQVSEGYRRLYPDGGA